MAQWAAKLVSLEHITLPGGQGRDGELLRGERGRAGQSAYKCAEIRAWFVQLLSCHVYFTPADGSWFKQVARWIDITTLRAIERGRLRNGTQLFDRIPHLVGQYYVQSTSFAWTAPAGSIVQELARLSKLPGEAPHWILVA